MTDGRIIYHVTKTVTLTWKGGSTSPYISFVTAVLDLSEYTHVYSITPRYKNGMYSDRCLHCVICMREPKKHLVGAISASTYNNQFTDVTFNFDIIAD